MYANENKIKFDTHLGLEMHGYLEIRLELDLTVVMG